MSGPKRPGEWPSSADNAEESLKCSKCGNTILLGPDPEEGFVAKCDVCGTQQVVSSSQIGELNLGASSNEDY